jgi:hypothetical protein
MPPPPARAGVSLAALLLTGVVAAAAGGIASPYIQPWLERAGLLAGGQSAVLERLQRLEAPRPAPAAVADPAAAQAIRAATEEAARARQQAQALEQRVTELAARAAQPAAAPAPDSAIAQLRDSVQRAQAAAEAAGQSAAALAPRLQQVERAAQTIGTPSAAASAAAKLVMAERLQRNIAAGQPLQAELAALAAVGAAPERLRALTPFAASGAPTNSAMLAALRAVRPQLALEAGAPDPSITDRLLAAAGGLVRVRAAGEQQAPTGAGAGALTTLTEQALQRGDAAAALAAFGRLPEPNRRAGETLAAQMRSRAAIDEAARGIMDDAVKALGAAR